ncbi:hypothetical protein KQX54_017245 [Cotesia glomerata]|uniref:Uncharacterized protein n=1 Tax=Cotesia glomerata TaxID=32391 RepID=A0AAV7HUI1_COTGL|nr:hypothetical protein KQX54_017245 [Cotesia glomerata]
MECEFEKKVSKLHEKGNYEKIIELSGSAESDEAQRLSWFWPTFNDLQWIRNLLDNFKCKGIVSVGCGTGLLEWIIQQYLNCDVIGIEVDKLWWQSKYSPSFYLNKIIFTSKKSPVNISAEYAVLFCYFNNSEAFKSYLTDYPGHLVVVIGPEKGKNRHTDPRPFDKKFSKMGWKLHTSKKLDNGIDCITAYFCSSVAKNRRSKDLGLKTKIEDDPDREVSVKFPRGIVLTIIVIYGIFRNPVRTNDDDDDDDDDDE